MVLPVQMMKPSELTLRYLEIFVGNSILNLSEFIIQSQFYNLGFSNFKSNRIYEKEFFIFKDLGLNKK